MLNDIIAWLLKTIAGGDRKLPLIHLATKYEFEADNPTHVKFAVVDIGEPRPNALDQLRSICLSGDFRDKQTDLVLTKAKCTVYEGLIEYNRQKDLLRILKNNKFYNVVMTPYLEIGVINGKKVLVDVRTPDRIRPKTKKEG